MFVFCVAPLLPFNIYRRSLIYLSSLFTTNLSQVFSCYFFFVSNNIINELSIRLHFCCEFFDCFLFIYHYIIFVIFDYFVIKTKNGMISNDDISSISLHYYNFCRQEKQGKSLKMIRFDKI